MTELKLDELENALNRITNSLNHNFSIMNRIIHGYLSAAVYLEEVIKGNTSPCGVCKNDFYCDEKNKSEKKSCKDFGLAEMKCEKMENGNAVVTVNKEKQNDN